MAEAAKHLKIEQIRPPNPFDFSSICEFLEQVLAMGGMVDEYSRAVSLIEQHANSQHKDDERGKEKMAIQVFDEEQFEEALMRTFILISAGLIAYKSLSPREQDIKREFLANGFDTSLKNALTASGFPYAFGKTVIGKTIEQIKPLKLSKALLKANAVFERAFYFTLKENELTKRSVEELVNSVRTLDQVEDLKQYLEALLCKVEVASTENSFNNFKKLIAPQLTEVLKTNEKEFNDLGEGRYPEGKGPYSKEKLESELARLREKTEILRTYCEQYFCCDDFIYVEKNLLQFKKSKAEVQDHNNKPMLSVEFTAAVDKKLIIQLITAFKKCYNTKELWLLKGYILRDLAGKEGAMNEAGEPTAKYNVKKTLILDALKRVRTDMIGEDTFTTATEQKKAFIETFEKELLQLSPKQIRDQTLKKALAQGEDLVSHAKHSINKKDEDRAKAQEDVAAFDDEVDLLGCAAVGTIFNLYAYNSGKLRARDLQSILPDLDPQTKYIELTVKKIESAAEKEEKKKLIAEIFGAFQKQATAVTALKAGEARIFQIYLKGLIDRVKYW